MRFKTGFRILVCTFLISFSFSLVSYAYWCGECQENHSYGCSDYYQPSTDSDERTIADAMGDMGTGAATVYGGIAGIAGGITSMAAGEPVVSFGLISAGGAAVIHGANKFWNGMKESWTF